MRKSLTAFLFSMVVMMNAAFAAERTVTLSVENMSCVSCPYIVKKALTAIPGVKNAEVSYE
ncbi:MAG TPA: mercuric transport protein periplasmic component, partial [Rhodospirillales bacterium]|nr:mercuric transport protein periplasmic component [Rhodospirillales bacterium]